MSDMSLEQKDKLVGELRAVIADAEELLRLGADQTGAGVAEWRARIEARLASAKVRMRDLQEATVAKAKAASHAADDYVHEHPWRVIGGAAGVGLIIGLLISRR